jgi:hypothetical protein
MIQQTAISSETIGCVMQQHAVFGLHGHFDNEILRKSFYVLCGILVEEQKSKMDYEEMFYHWFKLHFYHIITDVVYFFQPLYVFAIIHNLLDRSNNIDSQRKDGFFRGGTSFRGQKTPSVES